MNHVLVVLLAVASLIALVVGKVVVSLLSKEVEGRLDQICFAVLRIARRRLPAELRESMYEEEWLPELHYILKREEARPITRLIQGIRYALGLTWSARRTARAAGRPRRWRTMLRAKYLWLYSRRWGRLTLAFGPAFAMWSASASRVSSQQFLVAIAVAAALTIVLLVVVARARGGLVVTSALVSVRKDLTTIGRMPVGLPSHRHCIVCGGRLAYGRSEVRRVGLDTQKVRSHIEPPQI